ncbi:MAG: PQQ-binding-like beta-propeller repeat protein [Thermoleophilia bacterium]|nr:PQQ-binding-like beta-propeller repeat protein [Thermoleophilia bacterium]
MRRVVLLTAGLLVLLAAGLMTAVVVELRDRPGGALDTELEDVTVVKEPPAPARRSPKRPKRPKRGGYAFLPHDRLCWKNFGRDPQRSLALPNVHLGRPTKHFWVRGLKSYIEYPPSYCDGRLYVNTYRGDTFALNAFNGKVVWRRRGRGNKPSTPAIDGPRLIVSSTDGTVTALRRSDGHRLWQLRIRGAKIESSPVVVGRVAYFGATDGRLFAVYTRTGRVRWAFDTGGRINSSPSLHGQRVCITTYAGSIFCLRRRDGRKLWSTYVRRDALRYESFYASASTDGRRLFTIARSGKVVALAARNGRVLWTHKLHSWGYSTPAVAHGRVFVGDFNGYLHAYRASNGRELWRRRVGGRILGAPVIVGRLVFFSTLEQRTYAARVADGHVVWRLRMGKYSPGIATDRHYFFSLNGIVIAYHARFPAKYRSPKRAKRQSGKQQSGKRRVAAAPKR